MLLVWRWLEEMGRYGPRRRVIRANLHVWNGPLRTDVLRERPYTADSGSGPTNYLKILIFH
jgi:hypothetical protein